jgi:hypothetical protein
MVVASMVECSMGQLLVAEGPLFLVEIRVPSYQKKHQNNNTLGLMSDWASYTPYIIWPVKKCRSKFGFNMDKMEHIVK